MTRLAADAERAEALARWRLARCEAMAAAALAAARRCREEAGDVADEPEGNRDRLLWALQFARMRERARELAVRYERLHGRLAQRCKQRRAELQEAAQARASCERRLETLAQSVHARVQAQARREAEDRLTARAPEGVRP